jgi:hypothetical protein
VQSLSRDTASCKATRPKLRSSAPGLRYAHSLRCWTRPTDVLAYLASFVHSYLQGKNSPLSWDGTLGRSRPPSRSTLDSGVRSSRRSTGMAVSKDTWWTAVPTGRVVGGLPEGRDWLRVRAGAEYCGSRHRLRRRPRPAGCARLRPAERIGWHWVTGPRGRPRRSGAHARIAVLLRHLQGIDVSCALPPMEQHWCPTPVRDMIAKSADLDDQHQRPFGNVPPTCGDVLVWQIAGIGAPLLMTHHSSGDARCTSPITIHSCTRR